MNFIHEICEKYNIENYTINDDGTIDVDGDVNFHHNELTELPIRFNKVTGYFDCGYNRLTTLKGSPKWVGGDFDCYNNQLTSLEFSPEYVGGDFYCAVNKLTDNLCETEIIGEFYTSLRQYGLTYGNYNEWRKLYKRKKILDELYTRNM
jgi:hypothetical protein